MYVGTLNTSVLYWGAISSVLLFWGVIGTVGAVFLYYQTAIKPKQKEAQKQVEALKGVMAQMMGGTTVPPGRAATGFPAAGTSTPPTPPSSGGGPLTGDGPWEFVARWGQTYRTSDRERAEQLLASDQWKLRW